MIARFVAYSATWRGVGFCCIKMGRSNFWAWIEVILLWSFEGMTLNLLRPRGTKKKSLGFSGGRGSANLEEVSERKTHVDASLWIIFLIKGVDRKYYWSDRKKKQKKRPVHRHPPNAFCDNGCVAGRHVGSARNEQRGDTKWQSRIDAGPGSCPWAPSKSILWNTREFYTTPLIKK